MDSGPLDHPWTTRKLVVVHEKRRSGGGCGPLDHCGPPKNITPETRRDCMSFLDTMREILQTEGLLKHDTQKASPLRATEPLVALPTPCQLCGADSWWRSGAAEAWQCRTCHPLVRVPGYEVLGPRGKLGDAVRTQPRADTEAWLAAWREVAKLTDGVKAEDPRCQLILAVIDQCYAAFERGDWPAFQQAVAQVRLAVQMEHER